jgi:hypothetical protein
MGPGKDNHINEGRCEVRGGHADPVAERDCPRRPDAAELADRQILHESDESGVMILDTATKP